MRVLMLALAILLSASPAVAMNESLVSYCFTTSNPQSCISALLTEERRSTLDVQQRQLQAQIEQARLQAEGLMLFGAGAAYINGMNQGFHQMQLPYVSTPMFAYPSK